jgi:hypothetical protein
VAFEQSINGTHFVATLCHPHDSSALVTQITHASLVGGAGFWRCNIAGATLFRARIANYAGSGSISAYGLMMVSGSLHAASLRTWVAQR